jgi:aspartyl-tRNA(Asn)/glutamyl-tRNA(Gln) amidotransferase subunit C
MGLVNSIARMREEQIKYVAYLARLMLKEEEIALFVQQFSKILEYVEKINSVPLEGVEPTFYVGERKNPLREDKIAPSLPSHLLLEGAPEKEKNFFKVPRIIPKG